MAERLFAIASIALGQLASFGVCFEFLVVVCGVVDHLCEDLPVVGSILDVLQYSHPEDDELQGSIEEARVGLQRRQVGGRSLEDMCVLLSGGKRNKLWGAQRIGIHKCARAHVSSGFLL